MCPKKPSHKDTTDKSNRRNNKNNSRLQPVFPDELSCNNGIITITGKDASAIGSIADNCVTCISHTVPCTDTADVENKADSADGDFANVSNNLNESITSESPADNTIKQKDNPDVHLGHRERLRKKMSSLPLSKWEEHEALEVLLYGVLKRVNTNECAHRLIERFGSFQDVMEAEEHELVKVKGISVATAQYIRFISRFTEFVKYNKRRKFSRLTSYEKFRDHILDIADECDAESLIVMLFDAGRYLLGEYIIQGISPACTRISFRRVAEIVIKVKAVSIAVVHTHPSGFAQPSMEDDIFTEELMTFLNSMDVSLYDHFIWSAGNLYSYNQSGKLNIIKQRVYDKYR